MRRKEYRDCVVWCFDDFGLWFGLLYILERSDGSAAHVYER